jgi:hypothetical protein
MDDIVAAYMAWSFNQDQKEVDNDEDASKMPTYHICAVDIYGVSYSFSMLRS